MAEDSDGYFLVKELNTSKLACRLELNLFHKAITSKQIFDQSMKRKIRERNLDPLSKSTAAKAERKRFNHFLNFWNLTNYLI